MQRAERGVRAPVLFSPHSAHPAFPAEGFDVFAVGDRVVERFLADLRDAAREAASGARARSRDARYA